MKLRSCLLLVPALLSLAGCASSLQPTPPAFSFEVLVGESASRSVCWTNTGKKNIAVDLIDLNGDPSFTLTGAQVTPGVIPPRGTTPLVSVRFAPSAAGTFRATVIPSSLSGQAMDAAEASITGVAIYPITVTSAYMVARPAPIAPNSAAHKIDFGDIVAGTSAYRTVTLTNRNADWLLVIFELDRSGPFSTHLSSSDPQQTWGRFIPGNNGQFTIILKFTPQQPGSFQKTLEFSGRGGTHFRLDLEGRAHAG